MGHEAIERRTTTVRPTLIIDSTDLLLGHNLVLLVDKLRLGPKVDISLRLKPTADDKTAGHLLATGTSNQLDVLRRAFNVYGESLRSGLSGRALDAEMDNFFDLQKRRYGLTA